MPEPVVPFDLKMSFPETPADWGKTFALTYSIDLVEGLWEGEGTVTFTAPPTDWVQKVPFRFQIAVEPLRLTFEGIEIPQGTTSLDAEVTGFEWKAMPSANLKLLSKTSNGEASVV